MNWQPIETAPKRTKKVIVGYRNKLGKWRTVMAAHFTQDEMDGWEDDDCPEGWYELSETQEVIYPTEHEPTHWMPLPAPPAGEGSK